jgi:hypothetical protein
MKTTLKFKEFVVLQINMPQLTSYSMVQDYDTKEEALAMAEKVPNSLVCRFYALEKGGMHHRFDSQKAEAEERQRRLMIQNEPGIIN